MTYLVRPVEDIEATIEYHDTMAEAEYRARYLAHLHRLDYQVFKLVEISYFKGER